MTNSAEMVDAEAAAEFGLAGQVNSMPPGQCLTEPTSLLRILVVI